MSQEKNKALNIKKIPLKERPKVLLASLLEDYPAETPYLERLRDLATRFKAPYENVYQMGWRGKWAEQMAASLDAKRRQEEFDRVFHSVDPIRQDVPSSQIARSIKDLSFMVLSVSKKQVDVAGQMIAYYAELISTKIAAAGGVGYLSTAETKEIEGWQAKVNFYAKGIEPYLRPGSITALLESVNFSATLPPDMQGIDANAFTIARLQQRLLELGMATVFGDTKRIEAAFSEEITGIAPEELPELGDPLYLADEPPRRRMPLPPNPD